MTGNTSWWECVAIGKMSIWQWVGWQCIQFRKEAEEADRQRTGKIIGGHHVIIDLVEGLGIKWREIQAMEAGESDPTPLAEYWEARGKRFETDPDGTDWRTLDAEETRRIDLHRKIQTIPGYAAKVGMDQWH